MQHKHIKMDSFHKVFLLFWIGGILIPAITPGNLSMDIMEKMAVGNMHQMRKAISSPISVMCDTDMGIHPFLMYLLC
jgi:hypothetical protein